MGDSCLDLAKLYAERCWKMGVCGRTQALVTRGAVTKGMVTKGMATKGIGYQGHGNQGRGNQGLDLTKLYAVLQDASIGLRTGP